MSTLTQTEEDLFLDKLSAAIDAVGANDMVRAKEIAGTMQISPESAQSIVRYMGKEEFLELGFDLSLVERALGKGWIDATKKIRQ